jgi:cytochrome c oxidase cbb3-type subunit 4
MTDYETLRHLSDSWGLLALVAFFAGVILFVFRPGSKERYDEAAHIPLKNGSED